MEMLIPLIIVAFIVIHVIMYAFTIFLRRHFMLPLVEKFLAREDASLLQKSIAVDAFQDAISVLLPLHLLRGHLALRRDKEKPSTLDLDEENSIDLLKHCTEPSDVNNSLNEILQMMFRLNRKFNMILMVISSIAGVDFKKLVLELQLSQVKSEDGNVYVDIKHQHQH
ncbi:hypothetical protein SD415_10290 [Citrobacter braakii]|uniref:hypothetical protein n=1 Tax=Citrobacter TaxID=544 RepID=UPI000C2241CD|nr:MULTISPECIES: hypothetical protein [Citrobacter]ATX92774.1 hypothetical protein AM348_14680 [Citrobacter freundii]AVD79155.1 hypothetical protein AM350_16525 [Citrobacter freundii]MDH1798976.1 hypothetical protein [Citrobacter portucalensis]MDM2867646.1 hypothetical protein [Citrobacter sp. Cpo061]MDM3361850.1 hypothetical protein [Citrobacter sp. Cb002]